MAEKQWTKNVVTWFEIPVADFGRAKRFYERAFDVTLREETMGPARIGVFPHAETEVGACIVAMEGYAPPTTGSVV
jgi:hypothetical protein